jgi:tRNA (guanine37-N1)-methyltransferase
MADAAVRLLDGVLGDRQSLEMDSFSNGLLSAPNYTRPEVWRDLKVPDVLLSGNHEEIRKWRRAQSLAITRNLRPDLFEQTELSTEDMKLLRKLNQELD